MIFCKVTFIVLMTIGVGIHLAKHGERRDISTISGLLSSERASTSCCFGAQDFLAKQENNRGLS